jgi:SM-20-related protein
MQEEIFENLIGGLMDEQFGTVPNFITRELESALRAQLLEYYEAGKMFPAGVGQRTNYERNEKVRGDVIIWMDKENSPAEKAFLEHVEAFIDYLNRTCYTGINEYEFHFARYEEGSFYKRHRDQFMTDQGRKFSLVTYLNENWTPDDEGQLIIYLDDREVAVLPEGGRATFFRSDEIDHEVRPTRRARLSIAGWLKRV